MTALELRRFDAALFDMDGVLTKTAVLHAAAWKTLFDEYLEGYARDTGRVVEPFDPERDYRRYVDGKLRYDGVKSLLEARGIILPFGTRDDGPEQETICGLGNRKDTHFRRELARQGTHVYEGAIRFLRYVKTAGLKTAVVSASKHCAEVIEAAGLASWFDVRIDGIESERHGLRGKPAPDTFLEAARRLKVAPSRAIVLEDAIAGVEAGRAGGFGLVVGVDRTGEADALKRHGADVVVRDPEELLQLVDRPVSRSPA